MKWSTALCIGQHLDRLPFWEVLWHCTEAYKLHIMDFIWEWILMLLAVFAPPHCGRSSSDTCFCYESAPTTRPWNCDTNVVLIFWKFMWSLLSHLLQSHASLMWCPHTWRFRRCLQRKGLSTCVKVHLHVMKACGGSAGLTPQIITFGSKWSCLSASHTHTHTHTHTPPPVPIV